MSRRVFGIVSDDSNVKGIVSPAASVRAGEIENIVMDVLISLDIAPVMIDADGYILADENGSILVWGE